MARRNNSRKLPSRPRNLPLVGDLSPAAPEKYIDNNVIAHMIAQDEVFNYSIEDQLANMTDEQLFQTAIAVGVKATDALGVDSCADHIGYKEVGGRAIPKMNYATQVVWCKNCFLYYRQA